MYKSSTSHLTISVGTHKKTIFFIFYFLFVFPCNRVQVTVTDEACPSHELVVLESAPIDDIKQTPKSKPSSGEEGRRKDSSKGADDGHGDGCGNDDG